MKTLKRLLLRPAYFYYWIKFKIKEFFKLKSRFEIYVRKNTLGDTVEKIGLRNFNSWLSKKGFWRLNSSLNNLKLIVPKEYSELLIKYPNINRFSLMKELKPGELKETGAEQFYHYESGEVKKSDTAGPAVTVTINSKQNDTPTN